MESVLLIVMSLVCILPGLPGLLIADMVVWNKGRTTRYRGNKAIVNGAGMVAAGLFALIVAMLFLFDMINRSFFSLILVICVVIVTVGWVSSLFVDGTVERS